MMMLNVCVCNLFLKCRKIINIGCMVDLGSDVSGGHAKNSCIGIHCHILNNMYNTNKAMMGSFCNIFENSINSFSRSNIQIGTQGVSVKVFR